MSIFKLWDCYGVTGFGIIFFFVNVIALILLFANIHSSWQCSNYSKMTGHEVKFIHFDACYVNVNEEWIRYDSRIRKNFKGEL